MPHKSIFMTWIVTTFSCRLFNFLTFYLFLFIEILFIFHDNKRHVLNDSVAIFNHKYNRIFIYIYKLLNYIPFLSERLIYNLGSDKFLNVKPQQNFLNFKSVSSSWIDQNINLDDDIILRIFRKENFHTLNITISQASSLRWNIDCS